MEPPSDWRHMFRGIWNACVQREGDSDLHLSSRGIRTLVKLPALTSLSLGGRCLVTDETLSALRCMGQVRMMCTERAQLCFAIRSHASRMSLRKCQISRMNEIDSAEREISHLLRSPVT